MLKSSECIILDSRQTRERRPSLRCPVCKKILGAFDTPHDKNCTLVYEAVPPEEWDERIERGEIVQNRDKMLILSGKWTSREKKLTILHLDHCPYCHKARRALGELCEENPAYRGVAVEWIEEERESEAASRYTDYYYVPTIYAGADKLYEAHPGDSYEKIKAEVKRALDAVV